MIDGEKDTKSPEKNYLKIVFKFILLGIYLIILLLFYDLLTKNQANPLIIILILGFSMLIFAGSIFSMKRRRDRLYSKMFPKGKGKNSGKRKRSADNKDAFYRKHSYKPIRLEVKNNKPLIEKCPNCGMILANFVKKCPVCRILINK